MDLDAAANKVLLVSYIIGVYTSFWLIIFVKLGISHEYIYWITGKINTHKYRV